MSETNIVENFFNAYRRHDHGGMAACLAEDSHFSDYAFDIRGAAVRAMWHWFCVPYAARRAPVAVSDVAVAPTRGDEINARYRVSYLYGDRERPVDYVIDSRFRLRDGRIVEQQDSFATLTEWGFASMAFGFPTSVLAITPFLRPTVRRKALESLESFMQANGYR